MYDLTNREILIVGGGIKTLEKLRTFKNINKNINVIAVDPVPELLESPLVTVIKKEYETGDMDGFDIVYIDSQNPEKVEAIVREARKKKILVNTIDIPEKSDFISVSSIAKKFFTIFISTNGRGPGFARRLREYMEETLNLDELDEEAERYISQRDAKRGDTSSG